MADNFYSFVFDERARTEKFYKDLTDDDIKYLEAAARHDYETTSTLLDKYFRQKMPDTRAKKVVWRRDNKRDIWYTRYTARTSLMLVGLERESISTVQKRRHGRPWNTDIGCRASTSM